MLSVLLSTKFVQLALSRFLFVEISYDKTVLLCWGIRHTNNGKILKAFLVDCMK